MNKSEKFWDQSAGNYDNTEEKFEFIHRWSRENTKKYLKETDVVLDYGCGTGTTACEISSLVKSIRAIDISTAMIDIAKGKAAAGGVVNIDFEQADIFDEQFAEASFDVVLAFNMLHTVPDAEKVVYRTFELLKPGGTFISVTPCLGGKKSVFVTLQIWLVRLLLKVGVIPVPIRQLKSADLDALVSDDRFDVIDTEEIFKGASSYFMVAKKGVLPSGS
ncbi:class I SAM-dependent methyltransferase [uncultured Litoreibacter sp.]|uniref:class I SAM-dependent methyltransferase n=1 Tax=uncultured Litoreibacter sp. TaxID=1392394 RepID=UPI00260CA69D|nr:class I SAM-dependent methyltransferase [uncultured Litoreibacter sp.]